MLNSNMALQAHNLTLNSLKKSQLVKPKVWLIPVDSTMTSPCSMKVPLRLKKSLFSSTGLLHVLNFPFKQHVHTTTYLILHCMFICSLQVKLVTEAIKMDDAGDLKGAAKLYCEAMAFFLPAIECMSISCYSCRKKF